MREKLNRSDIRFLLICLAIATVSIVVVVRYFESAFPEASIDFKYDRQQSREVAEKFLKQNGVDFSNLKSASEFAHDENGKIYLERTLGLQKANALMRHDVKVWYWRHRWFLPLQTEEMSVDVAPTGEIVAFRHKIPEERAIVGGPREEIQPIAEHFLQSINISPADLTLVSRSERKLPARVETILTWESKKVRPANTPYRFVVTLEGSTVSGFSQSLKVPENWIRGYSELRSKNTAAGSVDTVFLLLTIIVGLVIFIVRLRRGDLQRRFVIGVGIVAAILVTLVALNSYPSALASYDTQTSFSSFVTKQIVFSLLQGVFVGLFLMVIVGSGEALYRERFKDKLAIPLLFRRQALASKRVFLSFILGYTLVAMFLGYQTIFYLVADHFGAWSPADIPYDDILNTWLPWVAVLFLGFFPAMSEEFMSRALSIPFLEKLLKSRVAAVIIAGFIWGFGHATYPNQPFYIRGVEVGIAGVIIGTLLYRFGLLPLLIWHYTVDALYTSFLLLRSHNLYYMLSGGGAAFLFSLPLLIAIVGYFRNGGFEPDGSLENGAIGTVAAPPLEEIVETAPAPIAIAHTLSAGRKTLAVVAVIAAVAAIALVPAGLDQVIDYRTGRNEAIDIARNELKANGVAIPERSDAVVDGGFSSWESGATREDGGSPDGFDDTALRYIFDVAPHPIATAVDVMKYRVEGATWVVRFFTPQKKDEAVLIVDPRLGKVVGFHHYQPEELSGARLDAAAAAPIAQAALQHYGLDPAAFDTKETLSYQQPNRRDWLFHYQERQPIAGQLFRRASVRVEGDKATQFAKTVWMPEKIRRDMTQETIYGTLLLIAKIVGYLGIAGMAVAGFVLSLRRGGFPWRRALRWSLILAPFPIILVFLQFPLLMFSYDTANPWSIFMVILGVAMTVQVAFQVAAVFVALAVLEALYPVSSRLLSREGRAAVGRVSVVVAITATALYLVFGGLLQSVDTLLPHWAYLEGLDPADILATAAPALTILWRALFAAILGSAIIASIVEFLRSVPPRYAGLMHAALVVLMALTLLAAGATGAGAVTMAVEAIATALFVYAIIRFVLRDVLLAYPLTIFAIRVVRRAGDLMANHRPEFQINAIVVLVVFAVILIWLSVRGTRTTESVAAI